MAFDITMSPAQALDEGAVLLPGFALAEAPLLLQAIEHVAGQSPFRHMRTRFGQMSVALTNCGDAGWVSDRRGYRYEAQDPQSTRAWPTMPTVFRTLAAGAASVAGFGPFAPDVCLVNRYVTGSRMALHQDRDEAQFLAPIVSVSLGVPAVFLWAGASRANRPRRLKLTHGDVLVWGGSSRLAYHGVAPLAAAEHPAAGPMRYNLTFRHARAPNL